MNARLFAYAARVEPADVPTAVNFLDLAHARTWRAETTSKKPWRAQFFAAFCAALHGARLRILELGSGPGHLARDILTHCSVAEYVALDFSDAMHQLAREHLGGASSPNRSTSEACS